MENVLQENAQKNKISIYVGNVPWRASKEEISALIATKAEVEVSDVRIISEKETGRSRGFAFVDIVSHFSTEDDFINAVPEMELNGRKLIFKHANPRENKKENSVGENTLN
jgi:RNA recognition motif-containing protein